MTSRDFIESVAGVLLPLVKIMLGLTFVGYDRMARLRRGHAPESPRHVRALGRS